MTRARAALFATIGVAAVLQFPGTVEAQRAPVAPTRRPAPARPAAPPPATEPAPIVSDGSAAATGIITPPQDYVIGVEDVLSVQFWRDEQMSGDVVVRPDGKITLRLLNDIAAAGLTTDQLRVRLQTEAAKFLAEPEATVVVKQINSRRVYLIGEIGKQGPIPLISPMTVLQLISLAGGLSEFAKKEQVFILRTEGGTTRTIPFNYAEVIRGRSLEQNILLRPGDTLVVP